MPNPKLMRDRDVRIHANKVRSASFAVTFFRQFVCKIDRLKRSRVNRSRRRVANHLNSLQNKYNTVSSVHCRFVGKGYRIANPPIRPNNSVCAALFWSRNSSTVCASVRRLSLTSVRILCRRVSFNSDERLVKKIL
jgi:hypothetical protein